ncbi:hypothetical protein [Methylocella sp.]|uniref:hypothetical protein n=1 Tax=Methylocella sp. TaxID=1978226 RepID=UPI0037839501
MAKEDGRPGFGECFEAACGLVRSGLLVGAGAAALTLFLTQFGALKGAAGELLARAGSVTQVEVAGVKIALDRDEVAAALGRFRPADAARLAGPALKAIGSLDPAHFVRFMQVGVLEATCEYERPTAQMRTAVALDYGLVEMGLTEIARSVGALETAREAQARAAAQGLEWDIGAPRECYDARLTPLGHDVRTALTQSFKAAFRNNDGAPKDEGAGARVVKAPYSGGAPGERLREAALGD